MRSKITVIALMLSLIPFLIGCWDQELLKDVALIKSQAIDVDSDGNTIKTTIALVSINSNLKVPTSSNIISANGVSTRDSRGELDKQVGSELFATKNQVTMISRKLAERDIYTVLDANYRSPLSTLAARLVVTDGEAGSILHAEPENNLLISDYLRDLLKSAEEVGSIPLVDLQTALTMIYDDGQDLIVPRIKALNQRAGAKLTGSALFSDGHMTGTLNSDQTTLLLLLANEKKGGHRMTLKVHSYEKDKLYDYITVDVKNMKREIKVSKTNHEISDVHIGLVLKLDVNEYPKDHLYRKATVKQLNETISQQLTTEANGVLDTLKEANCDYLGIGRKIHAFHYSDWENLNWKELYPSLGIKANVKVEIIQNGIIN